MIRTESILANVGYDGLYRGLADGVHRPDNVLVVSGPSSGLARPAFTVNRIIVRAMQIGETHHGSWLSEAYI